MSHTNNTTNYALPNFIATDKPAWMGDINPAMTAIDTAMHNNATAAATNASDIAAIETRLDDSLPVTGTAGSMLQKTSGGAAWTAPDAQLDSNSTNVVTNKAITENVVTTKNSANITNNKKYLDLNGDVVFPYVLEDSVLNSSGQAALHDSGWLSITPTRYNTSAVHYRKKGGVVSIEISNRQLTSMAANADNNWFSIPTDYAPRDDVFEANYNGGFVRVVAADGRVVVHPTSTSQYIAVTFTYFTTDE